MPEAFFPFRQRYFHVLNTPERLCPLGLRKNHPRFAPVFFRQNLAVAKHGPLAA